MEPEYKYHMRYRELVETPIADLELHGDDEDGSFRTSDLRAIKNPNWQLKVKNAFSKTPFVFNVYMYNGTDGRVDFSLRPGISQVHNTRELQHIHDKNSHGEIDPALVKKLIGRDFISEGRITALLLDNEGSDRRALTSWMLAHRICHAIEYDTRTSIFGKRVRNFLAEIADAESLQFIGSEYSNFVNAACLVGTMRSARDGSIRQNPAEFFVELTTQYLIQGKVSFRIPTTHKASSEMLANTVQYYTPKINDAIQGIFDDCVGKCFAI